MKGNQSATISKLYEIGDMVKLNKKDVDKILDEVSSNQDPIVLSLGPQPYTGGGFYGTISIYDFFSYMKKSFN